MFDLELIAVGRDRVSKTVPMENLTDASFYRVFRREGKLMSSEVSWTLDAEPDATGARAGEIFVGMLRKVGDFRLKEKKTRG